MPLRLLVGPDDPVRTARVLDVFKQFTPSEHRASVRLIVPSASRAIRLRKLLLSDPDFPGLLGDPICTLPRFAADLLTELDRILPRLITDAERLILLREVARSAPSGCFDGVRSWPGFAEGLAWTIGILRESGVTPGGLRQAVEGAGESLPGTSRLKLLNLAGMYRLYQDDLSARAICDHQDIIRSAVEVLSADSAVLQAIRCVIVDGFSSFTPAERDLFGALAENCQDVVLALASEDDAPFPHSSFEHLPMGHAGSALDHAKRSLSAQGLAKIEPDDSLQIMLSADDRMQVEMAAAEIKRLVRESGLRYSDAAIVTRDLRDHARIARILGEYGVPVAADAFPLSESALARSLLSRLDETGTRTAVEALLRDSRVPEHACGMQEHFAALKAIRRVLDGISEVEAGMGTRLDHRGFVESLRTGIGRSVYRLPGESPDGVVLATATALDGRGFRALFVLDLVEGVFPRRPREDPFINDWERRVLNDHLPHPLSLRTDIEARERRLFLDAAVCAQDRLYLCRVDTGDASTSPFVDAVESLFASDLIRTVRLPGDLLPPIDRAENARELIARTVLDCCSSEDEGVQCAAAASYNLLLESGLLGKGASRMLGRDYAEIVPPHRRQPPSAEPEVPA